MLSSLSQINPGATAFTVIPREASSLAALFVMTDDPCLGSCIVCLSCISGNSDYRCHADDTTTSLAEHLSGNKTHHIESSLQIRHRSRLSKSASDIPIRSPSLCDSCIVHQNINTSMCSFTIVFHGIVHRLYNQRHSHWYGRCFAAFFLYLLLYFLCAFL